MQLEGPRWSRVRCLLVAGALGAIATLLLAFLAERAHVMGSSALSHMLFWQNSVLQSLVPVHNIGTAEHPFYEGSPLNVLAYVASFPLGFVVYGAVAYVGLRLRQRGT